MYGCYTCVACLLEFGGPDEALLSGLLQKGFVSLSMSEIIHLVWQHNMLSFPERELLLYSWTEIY
jgi:hypothetical protein